MATGGWLGQVNPVGARLQLEACQHPTRGAVLQPQNVLPAHALQHPGANDAAGATGAVDDDGSVGVQVGGDVGDAQGQLAAGDAAAPGDAEPAVLLRGAGVQDNQLVAPFDAGVKFRGVYFRDVVDHLDLFAKVLAGYVDAPLGGVVQAGPAVDAAFKNGNVGVAQSLQGGRGQVGPAAIIVANYEVGAAVRGRGGDAKLQLSSGNQGRPGDVAAVVFASLPNVDQGKGLDAFHQVGQGFG